MTDLLIVVIVAAIMALAGTYVYKAQKRGQTCIGCPHSKTCGRKNCGCGK